MLTLKYIRVAKQLVWCYCMGKFTFLYIHAFQNNKNCTIIQMKEKCVAINIYLFLEVKILFKIFH